MGPAVSQYATHPVTREPWDEIPPEHQQDIAADPTALGLADAEDDIPGEDHEVDAEAELELHYRTQYRRTPRHPLTRLLAWIVVAYTIFHVPGVVAVLYWFFFSYLL